MFPLVSVSSLASPGPGPGLNLHLVAPHLPCQFALLTEPTVVLTLGVGVRAALAVVRSLRARQPGQPRLHPGAGPAPGAPDAAVQQLRRHLRVLLLQPHLLQSPPALPPSSPPLPSPPVQRLPSPSPSPSVSAPGRRLFPPTPGTGCGPLLTLVGDGTFLLVLSSDLRSSEKFVSPAVL